MSTLVWHSIYYHSNPPLKKPLEVCSLINGRETFMKMNSVSWWLNSTLLCLAPLKRGVKLPTPPKSWVTFLSELTVKITTWGGGVTSFPNPSNTHSFNLAFSFTLGLPTFTNCFHNSPNLIRNWRMLIWTHKEDNVLIAHLNCTENHHLKFQPPEAFRLWYTVILTN